MANTALFRPATGARRAVWLAASLALAAISICSAFESAEVTLDYVAQKAEKRAHKPFHSPKADLPDFLRADQLDYDHYRQIHFRGSQALWGAEKLPFRVEFFHPGYLYQEPVHINEFSGDHVQPIRFVQDFFDYGNLHFKKQIPVDTGYAGFRVLCYLNETNKLDELGSFLGASYFRLLGRGEHYGQSARGLAIDCGETNRPEEFPIFTDWWLGKPKPGDASLHLFAILDSVSGAGAYEFHIIPGATTVAEVSAVIYLREPGTNRPPPETLGFAPLTSMFWFGPSSERRFDDYRPEVHDSDGLLMHMESGETIWRPFANTAGMRHQRFPAANIRGFGVLQRDRKFADYQDMFNLYHLVPSVWIEPHGSWGDGELHLVELSTQYEGLDNVVAFWSPKIIPPPLQPLRFSYTMRWMMETNQANENRVVATRIGLDAGNQKWRQIAIDFRGPKFDALTNGALPQVIANCSGNAAIVDRQIFRIPFNNDWRVILKIEPKPDTKDPVDIRCKLKNGEEELAESWDYYWSPP